MPQRWLCDLKPQMWTVDDRCFFCDDLEPSPTHLGAWSIVGACLYKNK